MTDEFGFAVRPMTEAERKYSYTQSAQIRGQTGNIGFLRADMDTTGEGFYSTWNDFNREWKTQEFKDELDSVVNTLRSGDSEVHFLRNRTALEFYCCCHPDAAIDSFGNYGLRVDTEQYSYMMRVNPGKGEYNLYCYCYRRELLDQHLKEAERGIRFIDSSYKELFYLKDGDRIQITYRDGAKEEYVCRYIDPTHLEVGGGVCNLFHICEFAEHMEDIGARVEPVTDKEIASRSKERRDKER